MKTFRRIFTCTLPLFISTFCMSISAYATETNKIDTTIVTLEDIHKQLSQFAKSEIDCHIDFKDGLVVFASFDQSTLDEVNAYCANNDIDDSLVQLVLIEPEDDTTGTNMQTKTTTTTTTGNETTVPQTGYSSGYQWLIGFSSLMTMTITGAGIIIRSRKETK